MKAMFIAMGTALVVYAAIIVICIVSYILSCARNKKLGVEKLIDEQFKE